MKELRNEVLEILKGMAVDNDLETTINYVLEHGCSTGIVGSLIYYHQTEAFFNRHKDAICNLVEDLSFEIYGKPYEIYHSLGVGCNKNNLAWLSFEEVAREIANEMEIY